MNKVSAFMFFLTAFVLCTSQLAAFSIAQPEDNNNSSSPSQVTASVGEVAFFDDSSRERIYYGTASQVVYVGVQVYGPLVSVIRIDVVRDIVFAPDSVIQRSETEETKTISSGDFGIYYTGSFMLDNSNNDFGLSFGEISGYFVRIQIESGIIYDNSEATLSSGELSMLNPYKQDYDLDGLTDGYELYEGNTLFDDPDTDGDLLGDGFEVTTNGYDPLLNDTDEDGFLDGYEYSYGFDPTLDDSSLDLDGDGLTNLEEYELETHPNDTDTDDDGIDDEYESTYNLKPTTDDSLQDPDDDNLTNLEEYEHKTNPNSKDTDNDGLNDS